MVTEPQVEEHPETPKKVEDPQQPKVEKKKKEPFIPVITKAPVIATNAELMAFLTQEPYNQLRPLAKVVAVSDSILKKRQHFGNMIRKRVGAKEQNQWRQFIEPEDKADFPTNFKLLVDDKKVKEINPVSIFFPL